MRRRKDRRLPDDVALHLPTENRPTHRLLMSVVDDHSASPLTDTPRSRRVQRPELLVLVAGLLPTVVVYGYHWRRGYFLDDPFMDALSWRELLESARAMRARPLGTFLVGITYLIGEPAGRALAAIALAANAVLAALLVRRTCGGRYAPVVAALLVVYPLLDWESALYWYAAIQYPAGAAFGLGAGHLFLSTLRATSRRSAMLNGAGGVTLLAAALACTEVAVNYVLLLPGLAAVEALRGKRVDRKTTARLAGVLAAAAVTLSVLAAVIYLPENEFTRARGEFLLNPVEAASRIVNVWIPSLRAVAFSVERARVHGEALSLGLEDLRAPFTLAVFSAAVAIGAFAVRSVVKTRADGMRVDDRRAAFALLAVGIALFVMSAWFPAALLTGQGPVTRLLFTPWIALVLVVGAGVAALEAGSAVRSARVAVLLVMLAVVPLALTLDGYGELFRIRDARNREQLSTWLAVLRRAEPLPPDLRIATLYGSDRLLEGDSPVDNTLAGLTETPWALSRMIYQRRRMPVVAIGGHPFVPVCIERTGDPGRVHVTSMFNDENVAVDALLLAELRDGQLLVIDEIVFGSSAVQFPLGARATRAGHQRLRLRVDGEKICRMYGQSLP